MKLFLEGIKMLFGKFILRRDTGNLIKKFALNMGIVYIKFAQILAMQNYGSIFTLEDREQLSQLCDDINPIEFREIEKILLKEYGTRLNDIFSHIDEEPLGSASISQVHRAILKTGEEVVIKVKRTDITKTINRDVEQIRKLMKNFGWIIGFNNNTGGNFALDCYLSWIKQEIDFRHEADNIVEYRDFAREVEGRIQGAGRIIIPKVYQSYCTENVLVMDYIKENSINKVPLTEENKRIISNAMNSYIRLSFWALLNDKKIVFHGDPHSGNICVDKNGNIYFLDMGLIFSLNAEETKMCREFFLTAYSNNYEKLYAMLVNYGNLDDTQKQMFKDDCKRYCETIRGKEVTFYFVEMINILFKYELVPPKFLFGMAKVFLCINGISKFTNNDTSAENLLCAQTLEFLMRRALSDGKKVFEKAKQNVPKLPHFIDRVMKEGISGAVGEIATSEIMTDIQKSIEDLKEARDILRILYGDGTKGLNENRKGKGLK